MTFVKKEPRKNTEKAFFRPKEEQVRVENRSWKLCPVLSSDPAYTNNVYVSTEYVNKQWYVLLYLDVFDS